MQALFVMTTKPGAYGVGYLEKVQTRDRQPGHHGLTVGEVYMLQPDSCARGPRVGSLVPGTELTERPDSGDLIVWPSQGVAAPYVALAATLTPLDETPEWYSGPWRNPQDPQAGGRLMLWRQLVPLDGPTEALNDPERMQMLLQYLEADVRYQQAA